MINISEVILAIAESMTASHLYEKYNDINFQKKLSHALEDISQTVLKEFENKYQNEIYYNSLLTNILNQKYIEGFLINYFRVTDHNTSENILNHFLSSINNDFHDYANYRFEIQNALKWINTRISYLLVSDKDIPDFVKIRNEISDSKSDITTTIASGFNQTNEELKQQTLILNSIKTCLENEKSKEYSTMQKLLYDAVVKLSVYNYDQALELCKAIVTQFPNEIDIYNHIACNYIANNQYELALSLLNDILDENNINLYAYYNASICEYNILIKSIMPYSAYDGNKQLPSTNVDFNKPLTYIEKAYNAYPDDIDTLNFYGYLLTVSKKDLKKAETLLMHALDLARNHQEELYYITINLAFLYLVTRRMKEAIELVSNLNTTFAKGLLANIYATYDFKDKNKAISIFKELYEETKDVNYSQTINNLINYPKLYVDSIFINGCYVEIYTCEEIAQFQNSTTD